MQRSAGWYPDPVTVGAARWWNGDRWTDRVAWGGIVRSDSTPMEEVDRRAALHDVELIGDYLDDATRRGVLPPDLAGALRSDLGSRVPDESTVRVGAPPARTAPESSLPPPRRAGTESVGSDRAAAPLPAPTRDVPGSTEPRLVEPIAVGRVSAWWADAKRTVRTDLALHGIAYLGVLLLFAGVTGLVVFSFGDVEPWVRSLTELMVPTALFLAAWYLTTRDAGFVGSALELLAGAITPIVVAAAFTDGAPVPPDLDGRALPIMQGIGVALVALAMWFAVRRRPTSPLRFLVGPIVWLAAGLAAGALRTPVPSGYETAQPDALQLAIVLAAVATTLLLALVCDESALVDATRRAAVPATGAIYLFELVLAGQDGWPLGSTIIAGSAALAVLEAEAKRLSTLLVNSLQFTIVGVTALRLAAVTEPAAVAVGAFVALLGLSEYVGHRRREPAASWIGVAASGAALVCTLIEPTSTVVGFGLLAVWGMWRHVAPAGWLPVRDPYGVVPAVGVGVATVALGWIVRPETVLVGAAGVVLLVAALDRSWRRIGDDPMWSWFVPTAAGLVVATSFGFEWGAFSVEVAAASALSAGALALSSLPVGGRVWATAAAAAWALANAAHLAELSRDTRSLIVAGAGAALVMIALALDRPARVHVAAVGHVAGAAALAIPEWPGWAATGAVVLLAAGWWATAIVDERTEAAHLAAARRATTIEPSPGHDAPDVVAEVWDVVAFGLLCAVAMSATVAVEPSIAASWVAVGAVVAVVVGACITRLVRWSRPRRRVLEWALVSGAVLASATAIGESAVDRGDWSGIVATALAVVVIAATSAPRPVPFVWMAWVGSASLTLLLGDRLSLPREHLDSLLAAWGAVALLGAAGAQRRRHGPLSGPRLVHDRLTLPPLCLGTLAFVLGGAFALAAGDDTTVGWTAVAMSAVVAVVAVLLPLGVLLAIAELLATVAYSLLAPWDPPAQPVTYVPWVLLLLAAARLVRRHGVPWLQRRDLASFGVAHAVSVWALILAVDTGHVAATFASVGALSLGVSLVLRRSEWAIAAALLLAAAGLDAGRGWFALVLLVEGVALTIIGLRRTGGTRWILLGTGAAAVVGAWLEFAVWVGVATSTIVSISAAAGAGVAFAAAIGMRRSAVAAEFFGTWVTAGALLSVGAMVSGASEVDRVAGGLTFAGSILLLAGATAAMVPVLGPSSRWLAAAMAATAWLPASWAVEPSELVATWVATGVALVGVATAVTVHGLRPQQRWILPGAVYAMTTQTLGAFAALAALPADGPAIVVLLALSAELIALGVITGHPVMFVAAPATACAAWLLVAYDSLTGDPNWFTVPIGLTLLVMVGLVRWIRRGAGGAATTPDVVVMEYVAMTVMVAPPLALTLAGELWNAVIGVVVGAVLAGWGAVTRVTWRVVFGATTVVVAIVLVIAVPLSSAVTWQGPALWFTLSLLGVAAIAVATTLERSRDAVRQISRRLDSTTEDWDRVPWRGPGAAPADRAEPAREPEPDADHHPVG